MGSSLLTTSPAPSASTDTHFNSATAGGDARGIADSFLASARTAQVQRSPVIPLSVSELKKLIATLDICGDLAKRFDWNKASFDSEGYLVVPGGDGLKPLKLGPPEKIKVLTGGFGVTRQDAIYLPFPEPGKGSYIEKARRLWQDQGILFVKPAPANAEQLSFIATLIHEVAHADLKTLGPNRGDEYDAFKAQMKFLASAGIIEPVGDRDILKNIAFYYTPGQYARALSNFMREHPDENIQSLLPGGEEFKRIIEQNLERLKKLGVVTDLTEGLRQRIEACGPNAWQSSYAQAFLEGLAACHNADAIAALQKGKGELGALESVLMLDEADKLTQQTMEKFKAMYVTGK